METSDLEGGYWSGTVFPPWPAGRHCTLCKSRDGYTAQHHNRWREFSHHWGPQCPRSIFSKAIGWNTFPTESEQPHDGFLTEEMPVGWMSGDVTSNGDLMMIGDGIHVWEGIPQSGHTVLPHHRRRGWNLAGMVQRLLSPEIQSTSPTTINRIIGFNQSPSGPNSMPICDWCTRYTDQHPQRQSFHQQWYSSSWVRRLIIGDGMNTRLLCWDETPQSSGQTRIKSSTSKMKSLRWLNTMKRLSLPENGTVSKSGRTERPVMEPRRQNLPQCRWLYWYRQPTKYCPWQQVLLSPRWKWYPSRLEGYTSRGRRTRSRELNTFEGILYSDGKYLSISGMDAFTFVKVSKLSEDGALEKILISKAISNDFGTVSSKTDRYSSLTSVRIECWLGKT